MNRERSKLRAQQWIGAVLVGGIVAFICFAQLHQGPKDPKYLGQPLTKWLKDCAASEEGAEIAIREIGTNGIPRLLAMVESQNGPFNIAFFRDKAKESRTLAWWGFHTLGTNAQAAVPDLIELAKHTDADVRLQALRCLEVIHATDSLSLADLTVLLKDPAPGHRSYPIRRRAAGWIVEHYPAEAERLGVYEMFPLLQRKEASKSHPIEK